MSGNLYLRRFEEHFCGVSYERIQIKKNHAALRALERCCLLHICYATTWTATIFMLSNQTKQMFKGKKKEGRLYRRGALHVCEAGFSEQTREPTSSASINGDEALI